MAHTTSKTPATCACGATFFPKRYATRPLTRFCSRRCGNILRPRRNLINDFWAQVSKTESCWLWTGRVNNKGYGRFFVDGKHTGAHRVALRFSGVEVPENVNVLHRCDTPACVNPDHLFLGNQAANMADMMEKGRDRCRVVTDDAVRQIRARLATGERQRSIASDFGISIPTVSAINTGRLRAWLK